MGHSTRCSGPHSVTQTDRPVASGKHSENAKYGGPGQEHNEERARVRVWLEPDPTELLSGPPSLAPSRRRRMTHRVPDTLTYDESPQANPGAFEGFTRTVNLFNEFRESPCGGTGGI